MKAKSYNNLNLMSILPFIPKNILTDFTVICNDDIIMAHKYPLCMGSPTLAHLIYPSAMKGIDSIGLNYSTKNVILALKYIYTRGLFVPNKEDMFSSYEEGLEFIELSKYLELNIARSLGAELTVAGCFPEVKAMTNENFMLVPKGILLRLKYNIIISFMRMPFKNFLKEIKEAKYQLGVDKTTIICCVRWFMNIDGDDHKKLYFMIVYRIGEMTYRDKPGPMSESVHHPICKWLQSNPINIVKYSLKCKCCAKKLDPMKESSCCVIHPSCNDIHHFINEKRQVHLKQKWLEQINIQMNKVYAWMKDYPDINTIKILPYIE
jgi:hypothetical protein